MGTMARPGAPDAVEVGGHRRSSGSARAGRHRLHGGSPHLIVPIVPTSVRGGGTHRAPGREFARLKGVGKPGLEVRRLPELKGEICVSIVAAPGFPRRSEIQTRFAARRPSFDAEVPSFDGPLRNRSSINPPLKHAVTRQLRWRFARQAVELEVRATGEHRGPSIGQIAGR